jgi:nicotinamidase-related amidase
MYLIGQVVEIYWVVVHMDILLVMNPQNSFLDEKGSVYMGEKAEILKVRIADFLSKFQGVKIFFREAHPTEDSFFLMDKTHSVTNTYDFGVVDCLKKYANEYWDKIRYNAFYSNALESFLMRRRVKHIGILGVETHTSVLFTAESARNRDYEVSVIEACTMARDDYFHNAAISIMKNFLGARIE